MKLHILSDLHTEFAEFEAPAVDADVVVLAGDIGVGSGGVDWAARQFPERPVIYVPGNHEFYGHDVRDMDMFRDAAPSNVQVLNEDSCEIGGVRFLGCTLWTDFQFDGRGEAWFARHAARKRMSDFALIRNGNRTFTPEDSVDIHRSSVSWLVTELEKEFDGPTVVITHHLPEALSVAERYRSDPLNPAFASKLEGIFEKYRPDLWIHGHTHEPCDYEIFGTRVVCNPRGYPRESQEKMFSPGLVVAI